VPAAPTAVFTSDFPDPSVIRVGDVFYAYGTATSWELPGHLFPILTSRDLVRWTPAGDVFSTPPQWAARSFWAPSILVRNGTYFVYYSALMKGGNHCVAVATAHKPTGPFADHGPLACEDGPDAQGFIDPGALLVGDHAFLYFSVDGPTHHSISAFALTHDLLHAAGPRVELFGITQQWEANGIGTVEGPSVFRWGRSYVLVYSGGDWRSGYGMGWATAASPLGPFTKQAGPFLHEGGPLTAPGGGAYFTDADGRPGLAFHALTGTGRELHIASLKVTNSAAGPQLTAS
jgi:beta-xylosidase